MRGSGIILGLGLVLGIWLMSEINRVAIVTGVTSYREPPPPPFESPVIPNLICCPLVFLYLQVRLLGLGLVLGIGLVLEINRVAIITGVLLVEPFPLFESSPLIPNLICCPLVFLYLQVRLLGLG